MCGLTFDGFSSALHHRITHGGEVHETGTPVKSWKSTRAGMNSISAPCPRQGRQR